MFICLPLSVLGDGLNSFLDSTLDSLVLHALLDELDKLFAEFITGKGLSNGAHEKLRFLGSCGSFLIALHAFTVRHFNLLLLINKFINAIKLKSDLFLQFLLYFNLLCFSPIQTIIFYSNFKTQHLIYKHGQKRCSSTQNQNLLT